MSSLVDLLRQTELLGSCRSRALFGTVISILFGFLHWGLDWAEMRPKAGMVKLLFGVLRVKLLARETV